MNLGIEVGKELYSIDSFLKEIDTESLADLFIDGEIDRNQNNSNIVEIQNLLNQPTTKDKTKEAIWKEIHQREKNKLQPYSRPGITYSKTLNLAWFYEKMLTGTEMLDLSQAGIFELADRELKALYAGLQGYNVSFKKINLHGNYLGAFPKELITLIKSLKGFHTVYLSCNELHKLLPNKWEEFLDALAFSGIKKLIAPYDEYWNDLTPKQLQQIEIIISNNALNGIQNFDTRKLPSDIWQIVLQASNPTTFFNFSSANKYFYTLSREKNILDPKIGMLLNLKGEEFKPDALWRKSPEGNNSLKSYQAILRHFAISLDIKEILNALFWTRIRFNREENEVFVYEVNREKMGMEDEEGDYFLVELYKLYYRKAVQLMNLEIPKNYQLNPKIFLHTLLNQLFLYVSKSHTKLFYECDREHIMPHYEGSETHYRQKEFWLKCLGLLKIDYTNFLNEHEIESTKIHFYKFLAQYQFMPINATLLHLFAALNDKNAIKSLINLGANINAQDLGGCTPLLVAIEVFYKNSDKKAQALSYDLICFFLEKEADFFIVTQEENITPFDLLLSHLNRLENNDSNHLWKEKSLFLIKAISDIYLKEVQSAISSYPDLNKALEIELLKIINSFGYGL